MLIVFEGDLILRTHMRMNGSWHLYRHGERWWRGPQAMRVRVDTADWVAVAFDVPVAEFVTAKQLASTDPVAALGPDLLKPGFDRDEAIRRVRAAGALPIAQALLDQRLVAGIGNVYKSEVLFLAGIHPDTPPAPCPRTRSNALMDIARSLLGDNVVEGTPAAIQTYRSLRRTDRRSDPSDSLWVYSRAGKPCRKCGTPNRVEEDGPRRAHHLLVSTVSDTVMKICHPVTACRVADFMTVSDTVSTIRCGWL